MKQELEQEGIIKEEKAGYFQTKFIMYEGHLYLTPKRIANIARKPGVGGFGILGLFLKKAAQKKTYGFSMNLSDIQKMEKLVIFKAYCISSIAEKEYQCKCFSDYRC